MKGETWKEYDKMEERIKGQTTQREEPRDLIDGASKEDETKGR